MGRLNQLVVRGPAAAAEQWDTHFTRLTIERVVQQGSTTWKAHQEQVKLDVTPQLASGTIQSSLYQAADDAKVPDAVTNQMAEIFGSDIDFDANCVRKGDAFSVIYEAHTADGQPITWALPQAAFWRRASPSRGHQSLTLSGSRSQAAAAISTARAAARHAPSWPPLLAFSPA